MLGTPFAESARAGSLVCPAPIADVGTATSYDLGDANACSLEARDAMVAAVGNGQWNGSARCGECLRVTGPDGSVTVRVIDLCPQCGAGDLDLSREAFQRIADPAESSAAVDWQRVACPVSGPVRYAFEGSNPFYYKIQASHHRYGIAAMEYASGSGFVAMTRTPDNHFVATVPNIEEAVVRITATSGESLTDVLGDPAQADVIAGSAQFSPCDELFSSGFEPISS